MTPREELIDKVAKALEEGYGASFESVELATIAVNVIVPHLIEGIAKANRELNATG